MASNSYYIDYDPNGKPYLGMLVEAPPVSVSVFICYATGADECLGAFNKVVNELKGTPRKLIPVKGGINHAGLRDT